MKTLTPENLAHRGTVLAEAFLLSAQILSEKEMRRRILEMWQTGVRVFRREKDLIVRFPAAIRIDSRQCPGLPFVRYGKILSSFPLKKKDLENFSEREECLYFLSKGKIERIPLNDIKPEKIEEWFDVSDFHLIKTETLGEMVSAPRLMKAVSDGDINFRGELKSVPPADPQLADILAKLKAMKEAGKNERPGSLLTDKAFSSNAGGNPLANFFASVFGNLKHLFASGETASGMNAGYTKPAEKNASDYNQPAAPGVFSKIYNRMRHLTVRAVIEMRLAKFFGRRQAKYLAEMMEKFERGDLAEALKYAIPLEDMQALQDFMQKPAALFPPRPRSDLQISFGRSAASSSINLETEWFEHLRRLYRQSFERLEAQGRVEEAAFVLAELLKSNQEAVDFLAKHGKFRLAAELAEARNLPKETIVRQWFLAGEKMRAVRLAILYDCFEYAVTKLEQENSEFGAELRETWAESLARSGNYPAAVDVIWKLEEKRARAKIWMEKTIEFGGVPAARMIVRKTLLYPENFAEIKEKFQELISGSETDAVERRSALARSVFNQPVNDELRTLLRSLIRKILIDTVEAARTLDSKEFRELAALAKDSTLRTDLPFFNQILSPVETSGCFEITVAANDRGASFIYDACALPDGKIAVALGEAGIKLLSRSGKTIAYFDQPAQKLVVSDFSNKAIALARRGETMRLARIDFTERRGSFWCDAKLDVFEPGFDGSIWFIGLKNEFYAIDANAKTFEAVWRVPDVEGQVYSVVRSKIMLQFLTLNSKGFEIWWYELPSLTLRSRNLRNWLENQAESLLYSVNISETNNSVVLMQEQVKETGSFQFYANFFDVQYFARKFSFPDGTTRLNQPVILSQYSAIVAYMENQAQIFVFFGGGNLTALFTLEAAQNVSTKFDENYLTVTDDCGRLLIYDYKNRTLRQNLRI